MKLNPLNRLLLCACLLSPCLFAVPNLRAQDPEATTPEKQEKEEKKEKENKLEKRFEVRAPERATRAPMSKVRDRVIHKKVQKPGEKVPFLGVVLGPVDESLGAQLGLPDGVGILVRAVMDGSPAAKAGVMEHDVLHYFNDQLLVNEPQLQTLVRQGGIGSEVKLTLFRKGKSEVVTVKLGETVAHEEPRGEWERPRHFSGFPGSGPTVLTNDVHFTRQLPHHETYERELREFQERLQKLHGNAEEMRREIERFTTRMQEAAKKKQGVFHFQDNGSPDAKIQVQVLTDGDDGKGSVATSISSASGQDGATIITHNNTTRAKWKNERGSGELSVQNGRKHLSVKDAEGKEIYSGPLDTPEQRQKVPSEVLEQIERIEQGVKFEVRPGLIPDSAPGQPGDS